MKANEIISEIEKNFPFTDKRIEYSKSQMNDIEFDNYLVSLFEKFYDLINESIIVIEQKENVTTHQINELKKYLPDLVDYFFNDLIFKVKNTENIWLWDISVDFNMSKKGKHGIYIKPKDFTKEYVTSIVNSLLKESEVKDQEKDYTKETWFIVGLKFVDGTVYECMKIKKNEYTGGEFAKLVFSSQEKSISNKDFIDLIKKTRGNIGDTINFLEHKKNKDRNLFKEDYEYKWRLICDYHKKQGGKIAKRFAEHFIKIYNVPIE